METEHWMPRPWNAELMGCIWLPRMLDKGRQVLESRRQGKNLMNSYLFGHNDYADGKLLTFLRTNDAHVLDLLRESTDDEAVAKQLLTESGHSATDVQAWSKRFRAVNAPFAAMWDADEGRRVPGVGTTALKVFYNYVMMPPVYLMFWVAERLSPSKEG